MNDTVNSEIPRQAGSEPLPPRQSDYRGMGSVGLDGVDDSNWANSALCAQTDPDAFHPESREASIQSKRTCRPCEVKTHCLEYALAAKITTGVWGGMSYRERLKFEKARRALVQAQAQAQAKV